MAFTPVSSKTARSFFVYSVLHEVCEEKGYTLHGDERFGYSGFIEFSPDRRAYFMGTAFDINGQGASQLARDKSYTAQLLRQNGIPTPDEVLLFSPHYRSELALKNRAMAEGLAFAEPAFAFSQAHGFPLFIKPNEGTAGKGVSLVQNVEQLFAGIQALFELCDKVLLQVPVRGSDYRLVVLEGEVLAAYLREPFMVTGDGRATVSALVIEALEGFVRDNRPAGLEADDPRIRQQLALQGLDPADVPPAGLRVLLMPNANLSTGGISLDFTGHVHPDYIDIARRAAETCGLSFAGVDIMTDDISMPAERYNVIEVNSAPGLRNYAALSTDAAYRVKEIYARLVDAMQRNVGA